MKKELRDAIDGLRIFAVMLEAGEIGEYERQFTLNAIADDLEAIADQLSEADE